MSVDWFRSWHGAPTDLKWRVVAKRANVAPGVVSAIVWALFDYASQNEDRGCVIGFDFETYAEFSGFDEDQVRTVYAALEGKEIIIAGRLARWEKRQPKREDNSTQRVAKSRGRSDAEPTLPLEQPREHASAPSAAETEMAPDEIEPEPLSRENVAPAPISPRAISLADDIAVMAGHDLKFVPPTWCGAALRVEQWLAAGWSPPLILESVRAQMVRKRDGPPDSIRYFEKGIARAHAAADAPLPKVQPIEQETIHAGHGHGSAGGGFHSLARALEAEDGDRGEVERPARALRLVGGS